MVAESPPLVLPRGLIFASSLWLIGSWLITIGVRAPVQPSSASFTPGVRMMLVCVTIGLVIGWPLLRLSQQRPPYPILQTLLDLTVLVGLVQVVVWPLRLVTNWTPLRTAAIDAALAGWVALAGAVVATAIGSAQRGPRNLAMLACIAMCLLGPALGWSIEMTGRDGAALSSMSPITSVRLLCEGARASPTDVEWQSIIGLGAAALAAWIALAAISALRAASRHPSAPE